LIFFTYRVQSGTDCPGYCHGSQMKTIIKQIKKEGDTIGGVIPGVIQNVPVLVLWREPVFDKLHADWERPCFPLNRRKGFEYGSGFEG